MNIEHIIDFFVKHYLIRIGESFAILLLGLIVTRFLVQWIDRIMRSREVDVSLRPFLKSVISISLKIAIFIAAASTAGIATTSFITLLGAAGLAIGLAFQGSLSNFAGGVLILIFKPFRVGDTIDAKGNKGVVKEIQVLYTVIITADNKHVIIPNGNLSNNEIINFTAENLRRIDLVIAISYEDDLKKAKEILEKTADENSRILKEPKPVIGMKDFGDNAVHLDFWFWVKNEDFTQIGHEVNEKIKMELDANGFRVPYPHSINVEMKK